MAHIVVSVLIYGDGFTMWFAMPAWFGGWGWQALGGGQDTVHFLRLWAVYDDGEIWLVCLGWGTDAVFGEGCGGAVFLWPR